MDYVTRQFINLAKKFRRELPKLAELLHQDIKQHSEAIHAAKKSSENQRDIQPVWLDPILTKYKQTECDRKTESNREYSVHNSMRWAGWFTFVATLLAFLAAAYYASTAKRQLGEMKKATKAAQDAAQAASDGITFARETAHLDQRAWLGVDAIRGTPKLGDPFSIEIDIKNTGKTPAKKAIAITSYSPVNIKNGARLDFNKQGKIQTELSRAMIPPNSIYRANPPIPSDSVKQGDLDLIKSGDVIIYVHSHITYDDIFSCGHWLDFCYLLERDAKSWAACKEHNDTGDKQPHCPVTKPLEQKK